MKKQSFQMKQWAKVCLALSLGLPLTACVDDSYDASKDIDMTMGLGSQGLQLKLGNTENIMLADLLEEDENLKTDAQHTYYLIESGRTNVNFSVDRMNAYIDNAVLSPSLEVLNYSKLQELIPATAGSLNVPEGFVYQINNLTAGNSMNFKFDNISSVVKQVKSITPAAGTKLKISMALEQNGMYYRRSRHRQSENQATEILAGGQSNQCHHRRTGRFGQSASQCQLNEHRPR